MKSSEVQRVIDNLYIGLTSDSDLDMVRAMYSHVRILNADKYYAIEEESSANNYTFLGYAGGNTTTTQTITMPTVVYNYPTGNPPTLNIEKISKGGGSAGRITELVNGETYRVKAAAPVTGTLAYAVSTSSPPTFNADSPAVSIKSGTINLSELDNGSYFLDISTLFDNAANIMDIAILIDESVVDSDSDCDNDYKLELKNSPNVDYVFAEFDASKTELVNFSILTVIISTPATGDLTINLTPYSTPDNGITVAAKATFSVLDFETNKGETLTINATLLQGVTITGWFLGDLILDDNLNGVTGSATNSLTITFDAIDDYDLMEILGVGKHYITVYATSTSAGNTVYWAASIEVEVTDN